jgi:hypothetical protein
LDELFDIDALGIHSGNSAVVLTKTLANTQAMYDSACTNQRKKITPLLQDTHHL